MPSDPAIPFSKIFPTIAGQRGFERETKTNERMNALIAHEPVMTDATLGLTCSSMSGRVRVRTEFLFIFSQKTLYWSYAHLTDWSAPSERRQNQLQLQRTLRGEGLRICLLLLTPAQCRRQITSGCGAQRRCLRRRRCARFRDRRHR